VSQANRSAGISAEHQPRGFPLSRLKATYWNWRTSAVALPQILAIWRTDFRRAPPILVYQMGKVASTTVYESLRRLRLANQVYQVHFLSEDGIRRTQAFYRSINTSAWPAHIVVGKALARKLRGSSGAHCKIITLVRDPIARDISGFFQHVETSHPSLSYAHGQVALAHAAGFMRELEHSFDAYDESTDFACTWFDSELKKVFAIDVFDHPFDHERGYTMIRGAHAEVLVLRVEDLQRCFEAAIREFLELKESIPIPMRTENTTEERRVRGTHGHVVNHLRLSRATCEKVYGSRYCRHFYGEADIARLIARWART
jgi:hypothetical protein